MRYKLVVDSSCELNDYIKKGLKIESIPFKINIDDKEYIDNNKLDVSKMVEDMSESDNPVKTSCPGPGDFLKAFEDGDNIFVVTISSKLSGSYNSAKLAKNIAKEKYPEKFIHVFDSKSASIGQTLIVLKLKEYINKKLDKELIIEKTEDYINSMKTMFVLESLDNLIKNGRISKTKGLIASVLNFSPIMGSENGNIKLEENIRGSKRAFNKLVEFIGEKGNYNEEKILGISHNNALKKAERLKEKIEKHYKFKDIILLETAGLSSAYADDGGIIIAY